MPKKIFAPLWFFYGLKGACHWVLFILSIMMTVKTCAGFYEGDGIVTVSWATKFGAPT